jgi:hypothetical protein
VAENMHAKFEVLHHVHSMGRRALHLVVESIWYASASFTLFLGVLCYPPLLSAQESTQAQQNRPPTLLQL